MSSTYTTTFTLTHARQLAAKVVADLHQCSLLYGRPSGARLGDYEAELIEKLAKGYVATYEFGFKRNDQRVLSWRYTVGPDGGLQGSANAGALYARAAVAEAEYFNSMSHSSEWDNLTDAQQLAFESNLPFSRKTAALPGDGDGYWMTDHQYSAGGIRIERKTFRPR